MRVKTIPTCLHCEKQPAKAIFPEDDRKIFCTLRCAAHHGMIAATEEMAWCNKHRVWYIIEDDCLEDHDDDDEEDEDDF